MTTAQAWREGGGLGQHGSWRSCWLGGQGELQSEDEQRCHGPAQPESLRSRTWNPGWHQLTPALASMCMGGSGVGRTSSGAPPTPGTGFESPS